MGVQVYCAFKGLTNRDIFLLPKLSASFYELLMYVLCNHRVGIIESVDSTIDAIFYKRGNISR